MVFASPAFSAKGTLASKLRGCSACPATCTPIQRGWPVVNRSASAPSGVVAPSSTVKAPWGPVVTDWISTHSGTPSVCSS